MSRLSDHDALVSVGLSIVGPHWPPEMGRRLADLEGRRKPYHHSTFSKYRSGKSSVPRWVRPALVDLLKREIEIRKQLLETIDDEADTQNQRTGNRIKIWQTSNPDSEREVDGIRYSEADIHISGDVIPEGESIDKLVNKIRSLPGYGENGIIFEGELEELV